jgi:hydroxypyruvate isomerase
MPRFAANLSMMFTEAPFLERFAAAADAGSAGVECLFPYEYPAKALAIGWTVRKQGKSDLAHSAMVTYIEEMASIDVKMPAVVSA